MPGLQLRIAPLVELVGRQRDALVEHRRHYIHERHLRDDRVVVSGRHVRDRAHQQAASAAAHRGDAPPVGIALADQVARDVDEVGEGVDLVLQPALLVPAPTQLLATTDVGDRPHEAAVQQRQACDREPRIH